MRRLVEHVVDRSLEQLGFAREVVVERAEPNVGGVGDLLMLACAAVSSASIARAATMSL